MSKRLVYGVGINDANYKVTVYEELPKIDGKRKQRLVWQCPYYIKWVSMLMRCYSDKFKENNPHYNGCYVDPEWLIFSKFKFDIDNMLFNRTLISLDLDKDLLKSSNNVYNKDTCVLVSVKLNRFLNLGNIAKVKGISGAHYEKRTGRWDSVCRNPFTFKKEYLGTYDTQKEAHEVWLDKKNQHLITLLSEEPDPRIQSIKYKSFNALL